MAVLPEGRLAMIRYIEHAPMTDMVDQIAELIDGIQNSPFSRRHLVTAWHPGKIEDKGLPTYHALFQFNVGSDEDGELAWLDCQPYQRSADLFLGMPFNIASYAVLTDFYVANYDQHRALKAEVAV